MPQWTDLLKSYLQEAKWYFTGYTPTLEKYIDNAWMSISCPLMLIYTYFLVSTKITEEAVECLKGYPDLIKWSSVVFRLINDLGTSPVYQNFYLKISLSFFFFDSIYVFFGDVG